jgi:hypothetical protein
MLVTPAKAVFCRRVVMVRTATKPEYGFVWIGCDASSFQITPSYPKLSFWLALPSGSDSPAEGSPIVLAHTFAIVVAGCKVILRIDVTNRRGGLEQSDSVLQISLSHTPASDDVHCVRIAEFCSAVEKAHRLDCLPL